MEKKIKWWGGEYKEDNKEKKEYLKEQLILPTHITFTTLHSKETWKQIGWRRVWEEKGGKQTRSISALGSILIIFKEDQKMAGIPHCLCFASLIFACQFLFSSVQSLSRVRLFATPWAAALQASLSITNSQSLLKLMSIESMMPSNHLILCRPLLLPPSIFPSIRVFSSESTLHIRWSKYWSFSFNISPSNEHPGLISFRMDWFDLLAVQGTLKSLLQHHSSKASILWRSAFFIVQLSHPYMTTGKTRALTRQTFVGKVMYAF